MTLIERRRTRQLSLTALLALNLHAGHSQWIKVVGEGGSNPGRGVESMEKAKPKAPSKATLLTHRVSEWVSEWAKCSRTSRSQCTDSTSTPSYFRLCLTAYTPLCRRACAIICGLLRWKRDEESRGVAITHTHTHTLRALFGGGKCVRAFRFVFSDFMALCVYNVAFCSTFVL